MCTGALQMLTVLKVVSCSRGHIAGIWSVKPDFEELSRALPQTNPRTKQRVGASPCVKREVRSAYRQFRCVRALVSPRTISVAFGHGYDGILC